MGQSIRIASALALAIAARAQNRLLVPSQYPDLAAAVAAAQDGDTIELASGQQNTGSAVITKTLNIVGTNSILNGTLTITIPAGKALTMSGCSPGTSRSFPGAVVDLRVTRSMGRVTLAEGQLGWGSLRIVDSAQVLLRNFSFDNSNATLTSQPVLVQNSDVSLDACILHGFGAAVGGGLALHAMELVDSRVSIASSTVVGGNGYILPGSSAPGAGALLATNSILRCGRGVTLQAGSNSPEAALTLDRGLTILDPLVQPTIATTGGAIVAHLSTPEVFAADVIPGRTVTFTLLSPNGTLCALLVSVPADRTPVPGVLGDLWLDPHTMCVARLGVQSGGTFTWTIHVPPSWPLPAEFRWQGLVLDNGTLTLTDPGAALLH
jgi:hypothetical protein